MSHMLRLLLSAWLLLIYSEIIYCFIAFLYFYAYIDEYSLNNRIIHYVAYPTSMNHGGANTREYFLESKHPFLSLNLFR